MPRPPPPAAALMITGYPIFAATSTASSSVSTAPSDPGKIGTPAAFAARLHATLSPSIAIASGDGPMNSIRQSRQTCAKSARSARNPYPGWIASTLATSAAEMIRDTLRYDSFDGPGPMQIASSACLSQGPARSASE